MRKIIAASAGIAAVVFASLSSVTVSDPAPFAAESLSSNSGEVYSDFYSASAIQEIDLSSATNVVDVYVGYSSRILDYYEDPALVNSIITNEIFMTNDLFVGSGVNVRLNVVGISHSEGKGDRTGETLIHRIQDPGDYHYKDLPVKVEESGADVLLFLEDSLSMEDNEVCGLAINGSEELNPLVIWTRTCISETPGQQSFSLAHEVGHILGATHDAYVEYGSSEVPDGASANHGWVDVESGYRDIMAYEDACIAVDKRCPKKPYFSNPETIIDGKPFGDPETADSVSVMNQTAPSVRGLKESLGRPTVVGIDPKPAELLLDATESIEIKFSEPVSQVTDSTLVMRNERGEAVPATVIYDSDSNSATITPSVYLPDGKYVVETANHYPFSIVDHDGNEIVDFAAQYSVYTNPEIETLPSEEITVDEFPTVVFNKELHIEDFDGWLFEQGGDFLEGELFQTVTENGKTAIAFKPDSTLTVGKNYFFAFEVVYSDATLAGNAQFSPKATQFTVVESSE